jgi:hypothetical protein
LPHTGAGFPIGIAALIAVFLLATGGLLMATTGVIKLPYRRKH